MRFIVHRRQLIKIQMSVALGGRQTRVTEHFLNHPQIGAAVQ
jgi:hypothetical protein